MFGEASNLHFWSTTNPVAKRIWVTTVLEDCGYISIPMFRSARLGWGGDSIPVVKAVSLKTCDQKLVKLGHSQRMWRRWPTWQQLCQQWGEVDEENLASLQGVYYRLWVILRVISQWITKCDARYIVFKAVCHWLGKKQDWRSNSHHCVNFLEISFILQDIVKERDPSIHHKE